MSENTTEIFAAFVKFQGELTNAVKSKSGHGYKYADLAQCIETAREPLLNNGLAVTQMMGQSELGSTLTTMLTHSSGQWFRDTFVMERAVLQGGGGKNPAQAMGATITYMRRYAYTAIIGMTQEDEDAANVREVKKANASIDLAKVANECGWTVEQVCNSFNPPVSNLNQISDKAACADYLRANKVV